MPEKLEKRKTTDKTTKTRERATAVKLKAKEKSSTHASGFMTFIREQGVVGLAVGLAVGTAAGDTVRKLVEGFISPLGPALVGSPARLEAANWHVTLFHRTADFKWGAFVSSAIALLATALVVYWIVHVLRLDRLDRKKG